jgi:hypothetical protein
MSSIITFFVAPDNTVAGSVADDGPGHSFESVTYGNFDVLSSLEEWESLLVTRDLEEFIADGSAEVVGGEDGPLVLLVPPDLTKVLAEADRQTLRRTAARWTELRAKEGETIDDELAHELVREVAALSAAAERTKSHSTAGSAETSARRCAHLPQVVRGHDK